MTISRQLCFPARLPSPIRATFPLLAGLLLCGCTLGHQVPKATIAFDPISHQIKITSGKDVVLSNVVATFTGTNASISIGYYNAAYSSAVISAALQAQKQQIEGIQNGITAIVGAAISAAK